MDWMCSPEFVCWESNPQCGGVMGWGLWQVVRPWGRSPHGYNWRPDTKRHRLCFLPLLPATWGHHEQDSHQQARKQVLTRRWLAGALILDLPASRTVRRKCLLFKPPNPWHFVIAPWADEDNDHMLTLVNSGEWTTYRCFLCFSVLFYIKTEQNKHAETRKYWARNKRVVQALFSFLCMTNSYLQLFHLVLDHKIILNLFQGSE